ncbi:Hypothetical protein BJL86_0061 [Dietzia timorensis]|uniref:HTH tetR-type domain-containing protein n=1 Tax=Dietzia timorensis TaxID=499555 RepID=A0A173LJH2_9ACTN|nr:Hypothetical protein BJL86_0061 [Dietzia timorensis]
MNRVRQVSDHDDVRVRFVETAIALLGEEGPAAMQARRLSREVGASTIGLYHYFGGMPELLTAVKEEGFRRLGDRLAAIPRTDDPVADIKAMALAYRETAHSNRHLYDLMFGFSASGKDRPNPNTRKEYADGSDVALDSYGHLVDTAQRAMGAGQIRPQDAAHVAAQLWSVLHGFVTLELAGHFHHVNALDEVFLPMTTNLFDGLA